MTKELVNKATPKAVVKKDFITDNDNKKSYGYKIYSCPECEKIFHDEEDSCEKLNIITIESNNFCSNCGRALDWDIQILDLYTREKEEK